MEDVISSVWINTAAQTPIEEEERDQEQMNAMDLSLISNLQGKKPKKCSLTSIVAIKIKAYTL